MDKKKLSERVICSKFITPAITNAGWDLHKQIREEVDFTKGRIIRRGKLHTLSEQKLADYILYYKSNIPLTIIEAKDNSYSVAAGMQLALNYAEAWLFHSCLAQMMMASCSMTLLAMSTK